MLPVLPIWQVDPDWSLSCFPAAASDGGRVTVESGISDETIAELRRRGHNVERSRGDFGGYQAIQIDWEKGTLRGGTESRKDGAAVGY